MLQRTLTTSVPFNVVVEKMRGFVADHHAQIESIDERHLVLRIDGENSSLLRRTTDRSIPFLIEMRPGRASRKRRRRPRREEWFGPCSA